jgi:hypothetical protein
VAKASRALYLPVRRAGWQHTIRRHSVPRLGCPGIPELSAPAFPETRANLGLSYSPEVSPDPADEGPIEDGAGESVDLQGFVRVLPTLGPLQKNETHTASVSDRPKASWGVSKPSMETTRLSQSVAGEPEDAGGGGGGRDRSRGHHSPIKRRRVSPTTAPHGPGRDPLAHARHQTLEPCGQTPHGRRSEHGGSAVWPPRSANWPPPCAQKKPTR